MCVALTARKVVRNVGQRSRRRRRLEEEEEKERGFDSLSGGLSFRRRVSFYIECNKALLELELETFTKNGDSFSPLFLDDLDFDATAHHHHRSIDTTRSLSLGRRRDLLLRHKGGVMTTKGVKVAQAKTALDTVLAVATRFKDYNVRSYLARRAKDAFASMDADKNETGATRFIEDFAEKEMKWMARQERVYEMYGSARKSVVDDDVPSS
jgi:hypothetical protein